MWGRIQAEEHWLTAVRTLTILAIPRRFKSGSKCNKKPVFLTKGGSMPPGSLITSLLIHLIVAEEHSGNSTLPRGVGADLPPDCSESKWERSWMVLSENTRADRSRSGAAHATWNLSRNELCCHLHALAAEDVEGSCGSELSEVFEIVFFLLGISWVSDGSVYATTYGYFIPTISYKSVSHDALFPLFVWVSVSGFIKNTMNTESIRVIFREPDLSFASKSAGQTKFFVLHLVLSGFSFHPVHH